MPSYIAIRARLYNRYVPGATSPVYSYATSVYDVSCGTDTPPDDSPIGEFSSGYLTSVKYEIVLDATQRYVYDAATTIDDGDPDTGWSGNATLLGYLSYSTSPIVESVSVSNPWVWSSGDIPGTLGSSGSADNDYVNSTFTAVTGTTAGFDLPWNLGVNFKNGTAKAVSFASAFTAAEGCSIALGIKYAPVGDWSAIAELNLSTVNWGVTFNGSPATAVGFREQGSGTLSKTDRTNQTTYSDLWILFEGVDLPGGGGSTGGIGPCFLEENDDTYRDFSDRYP